MTRIALILFLLMSTVPCAMAQTSVYIVANTSVPVDSLAKTDVLDLYSFEVQTWENGLHVVVFDLEPKGDVKDRFYTYLGRTPSRMKSIWLKRKFSGEGDAPEALPSEEDMVSRIVSTPGAIGFVSEQFISDELKILIAIPESELL